VEGDWFDCPLRESAFEEHPYCDGNDRDGENFPQQVG
jgi:hypothetical protein